MTRNSETRSSSARPLTAAVVGLVLAGVAAWILVAAEETRGYGDGDGTTPATGQVERAPGQPPVRARVATDDPAPTASKHAAGAIRVVEADGSPGTAWVYTTAGRHWSEDDARVMGRTGDNGLLHAEDRRAEPLAFLWAFDHARIAGPEAVVEGGQTLTLGPGATIRVHVRRPDGSPITGAICRGHAWRDRGITGPEGHVVLSGYPSGYEVSMFAQVFGEPYRPGLTRVTTSADGSVCEVEVVIDATIGPFVLVRFAGDMAAGDEILLEVSGGGERSQSETLRGDDAPVLVSLRDRDNGPASLTARARGKRVASRILKGLAPRTTTAVELVLIDGGVPLRGRVLHADGTPAADVHVDTTDRALRTRGPVRTDEQGWFETRTKWLGLEIRAVREAEACSPVVTLHDDLEELVLTLGPGATIEGVVRDATTGRPIDGALVWLWLDALRGSSDWKATTDENGLYRFGGLPPGTFAAPMHVPSDRSSATKADQILWSRVHRTRDEALIREGLAHRIEGEETIRHDFVAIAEHGGTALVRLVFPSDFPAPEEIELAHAWSETDPMPDGDKYPDTLEGVAEVRRFLKKGYHRFRATAPGLVGESGTIHVAGNVPLPEFDIVMRRTRRVLARIIGRDGAPLQQRDVEVKLTLRGPDGTLETGDADTDASGTADLTKFAPSADRVDVPGLVLVLTLDGRGLYEAEAEDADVNLRIPGREWARRLREGGSDPWVIDVPLLEPPPVTVSVVDAQGRRAVGVPVFWESQGGDDDGYEAVSDDSGTLTLARFDDYVDLWLTAKGPWIGKAELRADASDPANLTMTVDRRRTVRVRVVLTGGSPVPHHNVAYRVPGFSWRGTTDADGEFAAVLPASESTFELSVRDKWTRDRVRVPVGATEVEIGVEPMVPVTLRLMIPKQIRRPPFANAYVGERRILRMIDIPRSGPLEDRIDLPRLPLPLSLDIRHPRYTGAGGYDGMSDLVTVQIEPVPLRTVVLVLVDESREPLPERAVHAYSRSDRRELDERVVTDTEGRVTLRVPPIDISAALEMDGRETTSWYYDPGDEADSPITVRLRPAR